MYAPFKAVTFFSVTNTKTRCFGFKETLCKEHPPPQVSRFVQTDTHFYSVALCLDVRTSTFCQLMGFPNQTTKSYPLFCRGAESQRFSAPLPRKKAATSAARPVSTFDVKTCLVARRRRSCRAAWPWRTCRPWRTPTSPSRPGEKKGSGE